MKKGYIDARYNYFMSGVVGSLIAVQHPPIHYTFLLIGIAVFINLITKNLFGKGDKLALSWAIVGCGLIDLPRLILWFLFFLVFTLINFSTKKILVIQDKTPFYPVILGAFLVVSLIST